MSTSATGRRELEDLVARLRAHRCPDWQRCDDLCGLAADAIKTFCDAGRRNENLTSVIEKSEDRQFVTISDAEKDRRIAELEAREAALGMALGSLLTAVSRLGYPMSDAAWVNTGDDAPINRQASVEARAAHREAVRASALLGEDRHG